MNTKEMIQNSSLWAGLQKPGMKLEDADVVIFGIPYDGAVSFRGGASTAPDELRNITYTIDPTTEELEYFGDLKVVDVGNVDCTSQESFFQEAETISRECAEKGKFFIMIGGDHSVTIPVQKGVDQGLGEDFGIIHLDAHFDLNDDQHGNKYSHGSTERRALELEHIAGIDSLYFIGIRSMDTVEVEFLKENKVNVISSKKIRELGWKQSAEKIVEKMKKHKNIYLTLDIDCLDPAYAAGTGTPQFGGMDSRELLNILDYLFKNLNIMGMDVVEVAPNLDSSMVSLFAARKIVTECMGHWYRKNVGYDR
ncbi:agmatinase [Lactonifactor longoviformis]|uniref:agmatinase n=1 Tax=Lactonifactor longoviformis TaxID=341220 RepID=UPI0036F3B08F